MSVLKICDNCHHERKIPENRKVCGGCRKIIGKAKRHDGVLPPTYEDTVVSPFKEPMQKVDGGFGYYGAVTESKDGEYIQCHICGYFFPRLSAHITKHKINARDHQNLITSKTKLVSWWREKRGVFGTDRYDFHGDCFVKMMELLDKLKEANALYGKGEDKR